MKENDSAREEFEQTRDINLKLYNKTSRSVSEIDKVSYGAIEWFIEHVFNIGRRVDTLEGV